MPRIKAATIEEHKELVRSQALRAAEELFSEGGYHRTTLGDIAARIGVGRTTLYEYFRDKEDLLVILVEESLPQVIGELVEGIPRRISQRERLAELAVRMMEFVATDSNLGTLLMREVPKLSPEAQSRVMRAHRPLIDEVMDIYRTGLRTGEFREIPPDLAERFIHDLIMASAKALLTAREPKQELHTVADALAEFLLHGFGTA